MQTFTGISSTYVIGRFGRSGTRLFRLSGTWDSATASLQYSEDGGATYRSVEEASIVGITSDMTNPVALLIGGDVYFRVLLSGAGGSTSLALWTAHAGA